MFSKHHPCGKAPAVSLAVRLRETWSDRSWDHIIKRARKYAWPVEKPVQAGCRTFLHPTGIVEQPPAGGEPAFQRQ